jgi:hypothetical protein
MLSGTSIAYAGLKCNMGGQQDLTAEDSNGPGWQMAAEPPIVENNPFGRWVNSGCAAGSAMLRFAAILRAMCESGIGLIAPLDAR